jgi:hypothetical protein
MKKQNFLTMMAAAALLVITSACSNDDPAPGAVSEIRVTPAMVTLAPGQKQALTATVMPADAPVTWRSDNEAVATVDADGEVTAMATGEAAIIAAAGGRTDTCAVTVAESADVLFTVTPVVTPDANVVTFHATARKLTVDWGDGTVDEYADVDLNRDAITRSYADNAPRTVRVMAEGLTAFGDDAEFTTGGIGVSRYLAGAFDRVAFANCPDLLQVVFDANTLMALDLIGVPALEKLWVMGNNLATLNLAACPALERLTCSRNQLTNLDVSARAALVQLVCDWNQLAALNVTGCTALEQLACADNRLTSLDVSDCTALTGLYCYKNQLAALDVSANVALTGLQCHENQLAALDVSANTALTDLHCWKNQLTSLDMSNLAALSYADCGVNPLTSLLANGCTVLRTLRCDKTELAAPALDAVFTALPDRSATSAGFVYVGNNPGTGTCDVSIATGKNWNVNSTD